MMTLGQLAIVLIGIAVIATAVIATAWFFIGYSAGYKNGRRDGGKTAWDEAYQVIGSLRKQLAAKHNRQDLKQCDNLKEVIENERK